MPTTIEANLARQELANDELVVRLGVTPNRVRHLARPA